MPEINKQDLESLLHRKLGKELVVESFASKRLTQPGENYGSTMLAIETTINQGDKTSNQKLSLVAKLVPPSEFLWKVFNPPTTFWKEINCYLLVKEEYKKIQTEKKVPKDKFCDVFPECYGARTTLSEKIGDRADENAVLLLENLKTANYQLGDRLRGLDLKHTELVVTKLAQFHALSVAIKILKPQVFKDTILKACKPFFNSFSEEELKYNITKLMDCVKSIPECNTYLERLRKAADDDLQMTLNKQYEKPKEPYAALCHTDLWTNNMMFSYDPNDKSVPIDVKFVDFQGVRYTSPVKDLIFFLYSSTADGVRAQHYEELVQLYHDNFTDCLKNLGCDTSPFSFQLFLDEIEQFAPTEIHQILFMLTAIYADEKDIPEMEGLSYDTIFSTSTDLFKRKEKEFVLDFVERGWL